MTHPTRRINVASRRTLAFFIVSLSSAADAKLCAKYVNEQIYNFNCENGYCCQENPNGCCLHNDSAISPWIWVGVFFAALLLAVVVALCCYYAFRSTFCRWFCWSSSFSQSHIKPLLLKSDKSALSSSQASTPKLKKHVTREGAYEEIADTDSFTSTTTCDEVSPTRGKDSLVSFFCCPVFPSNCCTRCPSLPKLNWFSNSNRKSLSWDDEDAMMIPGSKGRRRMGRPIHWVGKSPSQSPRTQKQRSLENVPVGSLWLTGKWGKGVVKPDLNTVETNKRYSRDDSVLGTKNGRSVLNVGREPLSFSESNLSGFERRFSPPVLGARGKLNQQIPIEWAQVMKQLKHVPAYRGERGRGSRRQTTCLDSREVSRLMHMYGVKPTRKRKPRKRSLMAKRSRTASARGRTGAIRRNHSEGNSSVLKTSGLGSATNPLDVGPIARLTRGYSGQRKRMSGIESAFTDVITQSSSDEDDEAIGRRRSRWYEIIKPRRQSSSSSVAEQIYGSVAASESSGEAKNEDRIQPVAPSSVRKPSSQLLGEDFKQTDTPALGMLDIGMWMTEQMLQPDAKSAKKSSSISGSTTSKTVFPQPTASTPTSPTSTSSTSPPST